jgi:hypothetical protein
MNLTPLPVGPLPPSDKSNLVSPTVYVTNRPAGFWQSIILDVFAIAAAGVTGFIYRRYTLDLTGYVPVSLAVALFLLLATFSVLLGKGGLRRVGVALLWSIAAVGSFYDSSLTAVATAGILFFVFSLWGVLRARRRLEDSLKIRFFRTARLFMSKTATGVVILFIALYLPQLQAGAIPLTEETFSAFFRNTVKTVNAASTNFFRAPLAVATSTFEEFMRSVIRLQVRSNPDYALLSEGDREAQVTAAAQELVSRIRDRVGVDVAPNESASTALYALFANEVAKRQTQFGAGFFAVWSLLAFFFIRAVATVFYTLLIFVAWLLFELLLAFRVIHIFNETRTQEVIEYS